MIEFIIRWSLNNRLLVLISACLLLLWGGWTARHTPVDIFPDLTAPVVTIVAEAHGMQPEDVERLVTYPLETAMNGATNVRRVRSNTSVGLAVINIEFEWDTNIYRARQIVSEKMQTASANLPDDLPPPVMASVSSIMGEIMFIALVSDKHSEMEIKTTADWVVRQRLLAVPGIAEVIPNGGETKQFQVIASPERLSAYGLSLTQLQEAIANSNHNASAGFIVENLQEYLLQGLGRIRNIEDIKHILVTEHHGIPVLVRDVADVVIGPAPRRGTAAFDGQKAVILGIQKQPKVNTLAVTDVLDQVIAELQKSLPEGMLIENNVFRQANFIQNAIDNLMEALRDGALLVVVIMFVFLLSVRATSIALMSIPLSVLSAILMIQWLGGSLNTMTLGGIAIAMGALVDDAIIVVENIVRRLRENNDQAIEQRRPVISVVLNATREIQGSIVFATLIIILVFLPLFFLTGVEGRLLQPLGFAYIISLAASLLIALIVTPALCFFFLPNSQTITKDHDSKLIIWLKRLYRPCLQFALNYNALIIGLATFALLLAMVALTSMGRGFLPEFNEGSLTITAVTLPGTALETTNTIGHRIENILLQQPEVVATARRTGRAALDPHAQQVFSSEIEVTLDMDRRTQGQRSKAELLAELRHDFASLPGVQVSIGQPISHRIDHMLSGTRANIAIKIFGNDLHELRRLGKLIEAQVAKIPGTVDVAMEQQSEIPLVQVQFNRLALANYGLNMRQATDIFQTAFSGTRVSRIAEGDANFDVVVRFPETAKASMQTLKQTLITLPNGNIVPIEAIADVHKRRGPNIITRENVQRKLVVMANVSERDLVTVVNDIRAHINDNIELPPGYYIEYGGQFESAQSAGTRLLLLGSLIVVGIFFLLATAFHSARDAGLIMLNLPLAIIGGVAGVWLMGGTLTIAAVIGFITLFGIATRNGVILIDHIQQLRAAGTSHRAAIEQGTEERLVPILMTALATALALIPLALAAGEPGSEIQAPMAMVILWGLFSSTVLNMLVVPAVYWRFSRSPSVS